MDLQLYRVDDQNYLVDFRNMGYFPVHDSSANGAQPETAEGGTSVASAAATAATERLIAAAKAKDGTTQIGGVSGPFHFLEMACQLIAELASG